MNLNLGFFRLWIILSVVWVGFVIMTDEDFEEAVHYYSENTYVTECPSKLDEGIREPRDGLDRAIDEVVSKSKCVKGESIAKTLPDFYKILIRLFWLPFATFILFFVAKWIVNGFRK